MTPVFRGGLRLVLAAATLASVTTTERAHAEERRLLLAVVVNGEPIFKIGEFVMRDGRLLAYPAELVNLGFKTGVADDRPTPDMRRVEELPGTRWRVDARTQTIYVNATEESLRPTRIRVREAPAPAAIQSGRGLTLNYDVATTAARGYGVVNGFFDARIFTPGGVASTDWLAVTKTGSVASRSTIRLDSTYTISDPTTLQRLRIGDFITGGLGWTRPMRFGGLQFGTDFSLRPDLITFPLPALSGSAAVPSTLDVMANGARLFNDQIGAGPFQVSELPVLTGAGTLAMTLTNALGQSSVVTLPFYASAALLKPGLQSFSVQTGFVRRDYGTSSDNYRDWAASGTYRRGVTSGLTVEAAGEAGAGVLVGGGGTVLKLGDVAILNLATAGSLHDGRSGGQISVGVQRVSSTLSFGAFVNAASRDFRDVAAMNGDAVSRLAVQANVGLAMGRFGSVQGAYAGVSRDAVSSRLGFLDTYGSQGQLPTTQTGWFQPAQRSQVVSTSYTVQLRRASIYLTQYRDFASRGGSGVQLGLTLPLGRRSSVGANVGSQSGRLSGEATAQRSVFTIGDWGYHLDAVNAGAATRDLAQVQYKATAGLLGAEVDSESGRQTVRLEAQGAVSAVDGAIFASNTIGDSFAIADTGGIAGVRVYDENREVGRTDSNGKLLVPDLRSYEANRISIDPSAIPPEASLVADAKIVRPQDRSGVVVNFDIRFSHAALVRLVDEQGQPLEVGGIVTLEATGVGVPVGYGGEAYLEELSAHNLLHVERADGRRCRVGVDYSPTPGAIPTLGPLVCRD